MVHSVLQPDIGIIIGIKMEKNKGRKLWGMDRYSANNTHEREYYKLF